MMLKTRIDILETGGVISPSVSEYVKKVIDDLEPQGYAQEKMEMFTTHLAMAAQRILNKEPVDTLDDAVWAQVQGDEHYEEAARIFEEIAGQAPVVYPEAERKFLVMHLCNLLQG